METGIISKKNILLVSNTSDIQNILQDIKNARVYNIIGYTNSTPLSNGVSFFNIFSKQNREKNKIANIHFYKQNELQRLFESKKVDEVLYIDSGFSNDELHELWELTRIFGVRYRYITNSFEVSKTNTSLSLINTIPVVEINNTSLNAWAKLFKRVFDLCAGIIGVMITAPIMLIVALLIKIEDPSGPIIYRNLRIGQNGKLFHLYKFRYMKWKYCTKEAYTTEDLEALAFEKELIKKSSSRSGPLYKIQNDPRKTKIGTFIEKYSIDEFGQFFNLIL